MGIFDDLRLGYEASQETYREYAREAFIAAQQLAHGFREYLDAPETYLDPDDETRHPYVRLLAFQIQDGVPIAAQPESHADLLVRDPDGYWRFAISLTLDRDAETFPKQHLAFFLRLKPLAGIWNVQLLDDGFQEFHIPSARNDERGPLFDHMVGMVTRLLSAKPWEGIEKLPIGFELHHPAPPVEPESPAPLVQP